MSKRIRRKQKEDKTLDSPEVAKAVARGYLPRVLGKEAEFETITVSDTFTPPDPMTFTTLSATTGNITTANITTANVETLDVDMVKFSVGLKSAAGSTQGTAADLDEDVDNYRVRLADGTKGVQLPDATSGRRIFIKNDDADVLKVYPDSNSEINELAANAPISMAGRSSALFVRYNSAQWYTCPTVPS